MCINTSVCRWYVRWQGMHRKDWWVQLSLESLCVISFLWTRCYGSVVLNMCLVVILEGIVSFSHILVPTFLTLNEVDAIGCFIGEILSSFFLLGVLVKWSVSIRMGHVLHLDLLHFLHGVLRDGGSGDMRFFGRQKTMMEGICWNM